MPPVILAFIVTAVSCLLLVALAGQVGWIDRREGAEYRKPREERVPLVGGAAIAIGVLFASIFGADGALTASFSLLDLPWMALGGALILGLVDDVVPGGLGARTKLSGQCLVAALFALDPGVAFEAAGLAEVMGLAFLCLVSMNAVNTYDHADGFAGGAAAIALLPGAPVLASAALGYLPFNTILRQRPSRLDPGVRPQVRAPRAMLGDSGSHMLGVALVAVPGAAWFLLIPALDLTRVAIGRIRRGTPFWRGDRTHLGHRLEGLGFHPTTCAAISALAVAPPLAAVGLSTEYGMLAVTLLASATVYFCILVISEAAEAESPRSGGLGMGSGSLRGLAQDQKALVEGPGGESGGGLGVLFPRRAETRAPMEDVAGEPLGSAPEPHSGAGDRAPTGESVGNSPEPTASSSDESTDGESAGPFAG